MYFHLVFVLCSVPCQFNIITKWQGFMLILSHFINPILSMVFPDFWRWLYISVYDKPVCLNKPDSQNLRRVCLIIVLDCSAVKLHVHKAEWQKKQGFVIYTAPHTHTHTHTHAHREACHPQFLSVTKSPRM